jgi:hypothetical protein
MEIERIANQLTRIHGPRMAWSVCDVCLEGIDAVKAAAAPPFGTHSIWEIVLHVGA